MAISRHMVTRPCRSALLLVILHGVLASEIQLPGLSQQCYAKPGDVLIGSVLRITRPDASAPTQCAPIIKNSYILQYVEAIVYAVEMVNNNVDILPNITLGYIILDTCTIYPMTLGQSSHFFPAKDMVETTDIPQCVNGTKLEQYNVVGTIGTSSSYYTIPTALAMSSAHIPIMGTAETSDELSDPGRFEYFVPLSLPDKYQSQAILQLLAQYNWTYFVLLYEEGSYGENGEKELQKGSDEYGICLEHSIIIYINSDDSYMSNIMVLLEYYTISKVIVLFTSTTTTGVFFDTLPEHLYTRFAWIGSDGTGYTTYGAPANGLINVNLQLRTGQEFENSYRSITPGMTNNPWWPLLWEDHYDCMWYTPENIVSQSNVTNCEQFENFTNPTNQMISGVPGSYIDAVQILANALNTLISSHCPEAFNNKALLQECIQGPDYLQLIKQLASFTGNNSSSRLGNGYILRQYNSLNDTTHNIGSWDIENGLNLLDDHVAWYYSDDNGEAGIPLSVCSEPCKAKQYIIYKAVECCWECRNCMDNEIIVANGTDCQTCEMNTWPDEEIATRCEDIPPVYLKWSDEIGNILFSVIVLGIALTAAVFILFTIHRHKKLIKASSQHLMAVILTGVVLAFLGAFVIVFKPDPVTCFLRDIGFSMSVTVIYVPLLLKTVRVYRIFSAAQPGSLRWISGWSQLIIATVLLGIQACLTVIINLIKPSTSMITMPVPTEKYTELICTLPPEVLTVLLSFNLILLVTCAVFGFLTRKLPENFNESWFIFVSVTSTIFIWIVFLPTYFTAFYAYHKTALLSASLILNGYITLICLFLPKIYAVLCVEERKMKYLVEPQAAANTAANTEC